MSKEKEGVILVTGATGFIALHIIQLLQREGYRVRGTVRSLKNEEKLKPLRNLCPDARYPLELVETDLTRDEGWEAAVRGCRYCIHVASPFPNVPPKREADVIVPALEGTNRVLQACASSGTIKRIVLTSSISAVHGEFTNEAGRVYTEDDWTDLSSRDMDTYARSKTMAEKAAWDFIQSLPPGRKIELVTLNPGFVLGPSIRGDASTSLEVIKRLMDCTTPMVPHIYVSICDVRDVALAHLQAMIVPEAANNRYLIVSDHMWMKEIAEVLKSEFGKYGYYISTWTAPYIAVYLVSFIDKSARLVYPRHGQAYTYSNRRMKDVLKVNPRSARETIIDTAHCLIESGALYKARNYKPKM